VPTSQVKRALLSTYSKDGLVEFARGLHGLGVQLISSGGTAAVLKGAALPVVEVAEVTGFPEILDGRVKTLNPKIHGGILARRDDDDDRRTLEQYGIETIDMVCVNLYPFEQTVADPRCTFEKGIENIDIGGPSLIRAAAKNHKFVYVLTRATQYATVLRSLRERGCWIDPALSEELAREAFAATVRYDAAIYRWLAEKKGGAWPQRLFLEFRVGEPLRYGENPHQPGAVYWEVPGSRPVVNVQTVAEGDNGGKPAGKGKPTRPVRVVPSLARARLVSGKELSFNNLHDADNAWHLAHEFDEAAAVVIKHANPCGAAAADSLADAFDRAYSGDPAAAYGGIVAFNQPVDDSVAERITRSGRFLEVIVAPSFTPGAVRAITEGPPWGKTVRLLSVIDPGEGTTVKPLAPDASGVHAALTATSSTGSFIIPTQSIPLDYKRLVGGLLVQAADVEVEDESQWKLVSRRKPTDREFDDLEFAWNIARHVRSNAVLLVKDKTLVGVGAGQMKRADSSQLAVRLAGERSKGAAAASDAFFPFRDGLDELARAGVTAVVQPGGSKRDEEVIKAADEHNIAMMFTGRRHFKH
jgi:phosphoribosylaminoimidazolecarboxamide formyltransferase/IMP cyclohydrolase